MAGELSARQRLTELGSMAPDVLASRLGGRLIALDEPVPAGADLEPITLQDEEGFRMDERGLTFVLLLALHRLLPGQRVRVEYSAGHGVFVHLPEHPLSVEEIRAVDETMHAVIAEKLPFEKQLLTRDTAVAAFRAAGREDRAAQLLLQPDQPVAVYHLAELMDEFYGAMPTDTGALSVFALIPCDTGLVLQLPNAAKPSVPETYIDRPKHLAVFRQSADWCSILNVVNAADLSRLMRRGMRTFIRVNEALQDKALARLADTIARQRKRVIFIAGPSSSGKTTTASRLAIQLRVLGLHPVLVSLDHYYLDRDTIAPGPDGTIDLEDIRTLNLPLLRRQIGDLLAGKPVHLPWFDFKTGKSNRDAHETVLPPGEPILFEGIHGLNPLLSEGVPPEAIHRVFVSALTCMNLDDHNRIRTTDVRLLRRMVRDYAFRGTKPIDTLTMWDSVRAGERKWIFPFQEQADSIVNTALHYELPFLKRAVGSTLAEIPEDDPKALTAARLLRLLAEFPEAPEELLDEVPPTSILREFIGGSTFDKPDGVEHS